MTLQEILEELNLEFVEGGEHHHSRPGWINLDCPWCGRGSGKFHLGYNEEKGFFSCWKCGGHHPISVLTKIGLDYQAALEFFQGRTIAGSEIDRTRRGLKEPAGRGPLKKPHREYLRGRGFDPDQIAELWQVEGIGLHSRLAWRLYIPIILDGQRVSWTTRAIGERVAQRYVAASAQEEAIPSKSLIYGQDYCLHAIVAVEGPTDAWRIGPGAGALMGTAFTSAQVRKLAKFSNRFLIFDNSSEAQARARKLAESLSCFPGTTEVLQIDAKDPGAATPREVALVRKHARLPQF